MRRLSAFLVPVAFFSVAACSAESGDSVDDTSDEAITCPSTDASVRAALKNVAVQAAACEADAPALPTATPSSWKHPIASRLVTAAGRPNHRARDAFYVEGEPQWVLAKLTYGANDKDLRDEPVDIFVQRGCSGAWEKLTFDAPVLTTNDGDHDPVEGVEDDGGRVYARIPAARALPIGHHRVRIVVSGDLSFTDQTIEVLPRKTPIFVSDVDGTLTERKANDPQLACDEESDFPALWRSFFDGKKSQPSVHEGAPETFRKLVSLGYRPFYLTARPEWLAPHTREFMNEKNRADGRGNLPQGIVHTTLGLTGAFNSAAEAFKKAEVDALRAKGFQVVFGFGNRPSDVATYGAGGLPYRFYFENLDTQNRSCSKVTNLPLLGAGGLVRGDFRIRSYRAVGEKLTGLAPVCGG